MIHEYSVQELKNARSAAEKCIPSKGSTGRHGLVYYIEKDVILEILDQQIRYAEERDLRVPWRGKTGKGES